MDKQTVAAIATAPGAAGIGIIRISGPQAQEILERVFQPQKKDKPPVAHALRLGWVVDSHNTRLDQVLAVAMPAPHSYTAEDVVELHCHGGRLVLQSVLELVLQSGAVLARPGEFTERAFLNGRLDLAQAEAVIDLIEAKSRLGEQIAVRQLSGAFSQKVAAVCGHLLDLTAMIEADIDYPEEEVAILSPAEMAPKIGMALAEIEHLLQGAAAGRIYREGIQVALAGRPNVGKSSLLNAILAEERALVSDIPGTTRDTIEEALNLEGIPLKLLDTAGLRTENKADPIEAMGIARAKAKLAQAQLILWIVEAAGLTEEDRIIAQELTAMQPGAVFVLANKADLYDAKPTLAALEKEYPAWPAIAVSAKTGLGLNALAANIKKAFFGGELLTDEQIFVSNLRQQTALQQAQRSLRDAQASLAAGWPLDMVNIDLGLARAALLEITGENATEELLDAIFSRFCLGK